MKAFLLCWDDVPEAVILADDGEQAACIVYEHNNELTTEALAARKEPRGTMRHWTWRELPIITEANKKDPKA